MNLKKKQLAKEIYGLSKNLITTLQILVSDVKHAEDELQKDKAHEQFWRRIIVRSVCALGEGTLNVLKGMTPKSADFFDVSLTVKEMEFLTEVQKTSDGKLKPFFQPLRQSLKETITIFTKIHDVSMGIKFDQGYEDFCNTFTLRNRLMHPRKHSDLGISDSDYQACIRGWNWFNSMLSATMKQCGEKLPFNAT